MWHLIVFADGRAVAAGLCAAAVGLPYHPRYGTLTSSPPPSQLHLAEPGVAVFGEDAPSGGL